MSFQLHIPFVKHPAAQSLTLFFHPRVEEQLLKTLVIPKGRFIFRGRLTFLFSFSVHQARRNIFLGVSPFVQSPLFNLRVFPNSRLFFQHIHKSASLKLFSSSPWSSPIRAQETEPWKGPTSQGNLAAKPRLIPNQKVQYLLLSIV
jgi:hypothetical protein